jgi:hypothetical protein
VVQLRRSCVIVVFLMSLFGSPNLFADCSVPPYRIGKVYENTAPSVLLDISVGPEDFAPQRLVCLGAVLRQKYRAPEVVIGIFSSHKAAVNYKLLTVEYPKNGMLWASKQHAQYYYSAERHEEYLLLIPDGLSLGVKSPFNTRIDLPPAGKTTCRLEINGRCLLQFEHIDLPAGEAPGDVTLTGRLERSGKVTRIHVFAHEGSSAPSRALINFAQRNLESWIFERSQHEDDIKITYSLRRVQTPLEHGINVQFMLPDKVNVEIGPMLMPHQ